MRHATSTLRGPAMHAWLDQQRSIFDSKHVKLTTPTLDAQPAFEVEPQGSLTNTANPLPAKPARRSRKEQDFAALRRAQTTITHELKKMVGAPPRLMDEPLLASSVSELENIEKQMLEAWQVRFPGPKRRGAMPLRMAIALSASRGRPVFLSWNDVRPDDVLWIGLTDHSNTHSEVDCHLEGRMGWGVGPDHTRKPWSVRLVDSRRRLFTLAQLHALPYEELAPLSRICDSRENGNQGFAEVLGRSKRWLPETRTNGGAMSNRPFNDWIDEGSALGTELLLVLP